MSNIEYTRNDPRKQVNHKGIQDRGEGLASSMTLDGDGRPCPDPESLFEVSNQHVNHVKSTLLKDQGLSPSPVHPPRSGGDGEGGGGSVQGGGQPPSLDTIGISVEIQHLMERQPSCGGWRVLYCEHCDVAYRVQVYCDKRFRCKVCAKRLSNKLIAKYADWVLSWPQPLMVTLTLRPVEDVAAGKKCIVHAFRKLRQTKWWKRLHVYGGWRIEILPKADKWYVHMHIICNAAWVSQKHLSIEWDRLTGCPIVDVRRIHGRSGLREVIKYATKAWELTSEQIEELESVFCHSRLFHWFGVTPPDVKYEGRRGKCPRCGNSLRGIGTVEHSVAGWDDFRRFHPMLKLLEWPDT